MDISFENRSYNNVEAEWKEQMTTYSTVTNEQIKIGEVDHKLDELDLLRTNRFLWAPVFNALQQTIPQTMVDKIPGHQIERFTDLCQGGGARHWRRAVPTHQHVPGAIIQKVSLSIEAEDLMPSEENYNKFKESLDNFDFFVSRLQRRDGFVMDGVMGPLTVDPVDPNRQFRTFTLASHFPEARLSE